MNIPSKSGYFNNWQREKDNRKLAIGNWQRAKKLHIAYCLLHIAHCLLPIAYYSLLQDVIKLNHKILRQQAISTPAPCIRRY